MMVDQTFVIASAAKQSRACVRVGSWIATAFGLAMTSEGGNL